MHYGRGLWAAIGLSKDLSSGSGPGRKEPGCAALSFLSFHYMRGVKGSGVPPQGNRISKQGKQVS